MQGHSEDTDHSLLIQVCIYFFDSLLFKYLNQINIYNVPPS